MMGLINITFGDEVIQFTPAFYHHDGRVKHIRCVHRCNMFTLTHTDTIPTSVQLLHPPLMPDSSHHQLMARKLR